MDCTNCKPKSCRTSESCGAEKFELHEITSSYHTTSNQAILQAAASLVDNGRAGQIPRVQETIEFIRMMKYEKVGLAYCYGMEKEAQKLKQVFKDAGIKLRTVSCTIGGLNQNEINETSCVEKVSCNPIGQASQLNSENVDFVVVMGICLGHDILLQRNLTCDFTTLVVKDRVHGHAPLEALM